jgi:hypothetical protein
VDACRLRIRRGRRRGDVRCGAFTSAVERERELYAAELGWAPRYSAASDSRYIAALGGTLKLIADFGDGQLKVA